MKSIEPAVVSTMPQAAGTKAQALKHSDLTKRLWPQLYRPLSRSKTLPPRVGRNK
jgi:hypothetical protein